MPELSFVLPHWLYWGSLILFPLITLLLYRRVRGNNADAAASMSLAYILLLTGGFIGLHRLYLKSKWSVIFIVIFIGILMVNVELRETRNQRSLADNEVTVSEYKIQRFEKALAKGKSNAEQNLQQSRQRLDAALQQQVIANDKQLFWDRVSQGLGGLVLVLLLVDAVCLPKLVRGCNENEEPIPAENFQCPLLEQEHDDTKEPFLFSRVISRINGITGEFVAYWSLIAVGVYYYEVMARYVFNSPTNWAHESMFLMFGMQYLLAGGFVLREGAHVRVDVLYTRFSTRGKAIVDLLTSIFFFIFMAALLSSGWTFFMDSFNVQEVSFTEWAIPYWPIKFALPLGAILLLLQGIAILARDIAIVFNPSILELDDNRHPGT